MLESLLTAVFALLGALYAIWIFMMLLPERGYKRYTPPVSIIIPAHNEEKYIKQALESLVKDDYPEKEIIVVDDGSTDRTKEIVKQFKKAKLLQTSHEGKAAAINRGMSAALYDTVMILDADSEISKGSIAGLVKPLKNKSVGAVTGVIRVKKNLNPLTWFQDYEYIMSSGWRYASTKINGNSIVPGIAAFRKKALQLSGGFSKDTLTEDFDVVLALKKAGYRTITVKTASISTNVPQSFTDLIRQRLRWGSGTLQVMKKHRNFIFSKRSGRLGFITIPSQLYWYVHAFIYLPVMLYFLSIWSQGVVSTHGYLSLEFIGYLLTILSVYGIADLFVKVITYQYDLTATIFLSLLMFFLSFLYTLIVFLKVSRPNVQVVVAYIFFFPYSLFNLFILALSVLKAAAKPEKNKWKA